MQLILSSKSLETHRGHSEVTWFLDLKDGSSLTDICNGSKDYCLSQKEEWAKRLNIDGGEIHAKLKAAGAR